jgi:hypothetical protein
LRRYATSLKVAGSIPDEVIELFSIYLILPAALGPGAYSTFNRNKNQKRRNMFLRRRARPMRKADNVKAICEPNV